MIKNDNLTFENKITWVLGLMIDCPLGKAIDSCPLKDYRKLPLNNRFKLVNQMSEDQLNQIILEHNLCIEEREKSLLV